MNCNSFYYNQYTYYMHAYTNHVWDYEPILLIKNIFYTNLSP